MDMASLRIRVTLDKASKFLVFVSLILGACSHRAKKDTFSSEVNKIESFVTPNPVENHDDTRTVVQKSEESEWSKLQSSIENKDWNKVKKVCYDILEKTQGQSGLCWNVLAIIAAIEGQVYKAEYCWKKAQEFNFSAAVIYSNKGFYWLNLKEWDLALNAFKSSLESAKNRTALVGLATLYVKFKIYEKGHFILGELPPSKVQTPVEGNILGILALTRSDLNLAKMYFEKSLSLLPNYKPAVINFSLLAIDHLKDKTLGQKLLDSWVSLGVESKEEAEFMRLKSALEKL